MKLEYQVAQKLHGVTEARSKRAHDLIDLQLIDSLHRLDFVRTGEICRQLFRYRRKQPWPPTVVKNEKWAEIYSVQKGNIGNISHYPNGGDFAILQTVRTAGQQPRLWNGKGRKAEGCACMIDDFREYYEATEPGRRERAYAWATAIGLQDVDRLKPSSYLIETAKRNIEGEITQEQARQIVDAYYESKDSHDVPPDTKEADKVAARMIGVINSPTFTFSPTYYLGLHQRIFEGVLSNAGETRTVELMKREWVLNGDRVQYGPSFLIEKSLKDAFAEERRFRYKGLSEDAFVMHFASFISAVWQIHPFREGNTRTVALFSIKYLRSLGYEASNDLFAEKSWFFRNALVRANYENVRLQVEKTQLPLEEFFKVLLFGYELELKNRFLRVGQEYGTKPAEAITGLHRQDDGVNDGVNDGAKSVLNPTEEKAIKAILRNSRLKASELAKVLGVKQRQAERVIASLKLKAGLKRRGADKNGEWYFE